jgi:hypothetical protein
MPFGGRFGSTKQPADEGEPQAVVASQTAIGPEENGDGT